MKLPVAAVEFLSEDFESVTLGDSVDEGVAEAGGTAGTGVWSKTPPEGWSVDDSEMAGLAENLGVTEWRGWSFASRDWWATTAGDQRRTEFTLGTGTVAVADPDEWDDVGSPSGTGTFNSLLIRDVDIAAAATNSLQLDFDSSFRPEGNQNAFVSVSYDGEEEIRVIDWVATSDDKTNEHVSLQLSNPSGAAVLTLTFGMTDAGNNWFWAVDNIVVSSNVLFAEDFEGLELGDPVDEAFEEMVWTKTAPEGWTIDDSGVPSIEDDEFMEFGVTEWEGWSFANKEWWITVAGDQRRSEFLSGQGTVAIADPDEWDDKGSPFDTLGVFETLLSTPAIGLDGLAPNTVLLTFDSSWRPEFDSSNQSADLRVKFDDGEPIVLFTWVSDGGDPNFKDEAIDEQIILPLNNPEGAKTMVITWRMFDAGNDWWWALDNIAVTAGGPPPEPRISSGPDFVLAELADTGVVKLDQSEIKLSIDGTEVPTTITEADGFLQVRYVADPKFVPGSDHTYVLVAKNTQGNEFSWEGTVQVSPPILPFLTPLPGADIVDNMWSVRYVFDAGTLQSLSVAIDALQRASEAGFEGQIIDVAQQFMDQGSAGIFADSESEYPDEVLDNEFWTGEDFVVFGHGFVVVPKTATYSIGVHSDDGMAVRIFGAEFTNSQGAAVIDRISPDTWAHPGTTGDSNSRAVVMLKAGTYEIEFVWYERGGGDHGEVYAAEGEFLADGDTDTWKLIGDPEGLLKMGKDANAVLFQITEIVNTAAADGAPASTEITWESKEGSQYTLETSTNLKDFVELSDGLASEGATTTFKHEGAEVPERYYRVTEEN